MASAPTSGSYVDVRYSKFYAFTLILLSLVFFALVVDECITLRRELFQGSNFVVPSIYLLLGLLFLISGITLRNRRYLRLDLNNKVLMVFGTVGSWSRKYPYDSIYLAGEKFYLEKEGRRRKMGFLKYTCDKTDLHSLALALKELS
jgi:hypothetical protein